MITASPAGTTRAGASALARKGYEMSEELKQTRWQELWARAALDTGDESEDSHAIGLREGFEEAAALIDRLTGGDGEYRYCTDHDPERHCPDPDAMIARIVERCNPPQSPSPSNVERVAEAIHDARWVHGVSNPGHESFANEDRSGREYCYRLARAALSAMPNPKGEPIDMLLWCPRCHTQHIDEPEDGFHEGQDAQTGAFSVGWENPPHRSHLCHGCGCIWRPADVPTNGVRSIATAGRVDTWPDHPDDISTGQGEES